MSLVTFCPHNPDELCDCRLQECPCCAGLGVAMQCPSCDGAGAIRSRTKRLAELAHVDPFERCETCKGRGWFPISIAMYEKLGFERPSTENYRILKKRPARAG